MSILPYLVTGLQILQTIGQQLNERSARSQILSQLEKAKFSESEKEKLLRELDRSYNTTAINSLNNTALGLSGVLNADTYRGLLANKILGQRASDRLKLISQIEEHNKKIELEKASVPFPSIPDVSSIPLTYISTKALEGALSKLLNNKDEGDRREPPSGPVIDSPTSNSSIDFLGYKDKEEESVTSDVLSMSAGAINLTDLFGNKLEKIKGTPGRPAKTINLDTDLLSAIRRWSG